MTFLVISFIAGVLTVLAPCILPLLPVIVGSSVARRSKATPYIVIASLGVSIILFTYLLKVTTFFIAIPPSVWGYISGGILFLFGIVLVFPNLWARIPSVSRLGVTSNKIVGEGYTKKSVWGDILMGAALGPVFSTCSPTYFVILATVLPASFVLGTVYLIAYITGLMIVLLGIALLGERLVSKLAFAADPRGLFKRGVGVLFIVLGLIIALGYDKKIETALLDLGFFTTTSFEQGLLDTYQ